MHYVFELKTKGRQSIMTNANTTPKTEVKNCNKVIKKTQAYKYEKRLPCSQALTYTKEVPNDSASSGKGEDVSTQYSQLLTSCICDGAARSPVRMSSVLSQSRAVAAP